MIVVKMLAFLPPLMAEEKGGRSESDRIVITAREIKEMNVRTIVEVLNQIPGVDAGEHSVSLRGSYMVRVLLDGRPINDPLSGHRAIKWNLVSLNDIEKIEINKGGGAVAFGDDTSGGVISITTKKIKGFHGYLEAMGGKLDTQSYSLNMRKDIKPFGIGLSAGWDKTEGFRRNGDKDKKRVGTKVSFSPERKYSFHLSLDWAKEDRGMPGLPAFPTPRARSENESFGCSLLGKMGQLRIGTHFNRFEKKNANPDTFLYTILKSWSLREDIKSDLSLPKLGLITTGANFEVAHLKGNKVKSIHEEKYGIYAAKEIHFRRVPLTLGLGLRWNLYSEFQQVVNPEIKVDFKRDNFSFQVSVTKTNNTPTFLQRYYESSTTKPNPDLGMEKAVNYSTTLVFNPVKSLQGLITLFRSKVEDRITYVRRDGGIGSYENFGKVTLKGVEASVKWKIGGSWEIKPSYIYLSAKDERTGNWLPAKAEHKARLDIRYKPFADLTLHLDTRYVSKQYSRADNTESVPEYFRVDLRADYYLKKVRLFLKIENLFDKKYYYGDGYPAPPLTWSGGVNYEF